MIFLKKIAVILSLILFKGDVLGMERVLQQVAVQQQEPSSAQDRTCNDLPRVVIQGNGNLIYDPRVTASPQVHIETSFLSWQTVEQTVSQVSQQTTNVIYSIGGYCCWLGNQVKSKAQEIWQWCEDHKGAVIAGILVVLAISLAVLVVSLQAQLKDDKKNWSQWDPHRDGEITATDILSTPMRQIHQEAVGVTRTMGDTLLSSIQSRYINKDWPLDLTVPLKAFVHDVTTERGRMELLSNIAFYLKKLRMSGAFRVDNELIVSFPGRLTMLSDLQKIALITASRMNMQNQSPVDERLQELSGALHELIILLASAHGAHDVPLTPAPTDSV